MLRLRSGSAFHLLVSAASLSLVLAGCGSVENTGSNETDSGTTVDGSGGGDGPVSTVDAPVTGGEAGAGLEGGTGADAPVTGGEAGTSDEAGVPDCTGKGDGTECGDGMLCLKSTCASSSCGDGYVDSRTGEECEDGNTAAGDGCFNCRFECRSNPDCDDKNPCNGAETCDTSAPGKRLCKEGAAPAAESACTLDGGAAGKCRGGQCVQGKCGDGVVDGAAGEECDEQKAACTSACKWACKADADCDDGSLCTGKETCVDHECKPGTAVTCSANGCTGTCTPATGVCVYPDVDKDGKRCDTDCNDADPAVFPGAFECKDGKDNDCNASTADATAGDCFCYVDTDKDGYAVNTTNAVASPGACQPGYTRRKPEDAASIDCGPTVPSANPGQASYFPTSYCPSGFFIGIPRQCAGGVSFDYDCDKKEEPMSNKLAADTCAKPAASLIYCIARSGWVGIVPACGKPGTFRQCSWNAKARSCSGTDTANRIQECR